MFRKPPYIWFFAVRLVAALWFIWALTSLLGVAFPGFAGALKSLLSLRPSGILGGFTGTVSALWGLALAFFEGLIGYFIWRMEENIRMSIVFLSVLMLAFSVLSFNILLSGVLLLTIFTLLYRETARLFVPGGRNTKFFGLEKIFRRNFWRKNRKYWDSDYWERMTRK